MAAPAYRVRWREVRHDSNTGRPQRYHSIVSAGEVVVALPIPRERIHPATEVRSTLLCASLSALDKHGMLARYRSELDPSFESTMFSLTAGHWVPVDIAVKHYEACNRLRLEHDVIEDIGNSVGQRIQKSVLNVLVRISREAGATPWTALAQVPRLNDLTWRGGAFEIVKVGPKDARLEWVGQPCAATDYYRTSFCGFVRGLLDLFCQRSYVRPNRDRCDATTIALKIAWA
jgi:hypothetical protein